MRDRSVHLARRLPILRSVASKLTLLRHAFNRRYQSAGFVPPGHFYSPIPSLAEVERDEAKIFPDLPPRHIRSIELREQQQLDLLNSFRDFYAELPFPAEKSGSTRYYFENPAYSYSDAILLYCMLRHLRPRRVIEIGSGFSSCVILDTRERFLGKATDLTFIDPFPELLVSLLSDEDQADVRILPHRVQDVDLGLFDSLESGDILFIDSTHVSKVNSDVNKIFFDVFPRLNRGVHIHLHDVFYPFEYPKQWIYDGRAWNELYVLRAFLQYNHDFKIVLMNSFMHCFHESFFTEHMPLCLKNPGASIWMERT